MAQFLCLCFAAAIGVSFAMPPWAGKGERGPGGYSGEGGHGGEGEMMIPEMIMMKMKMLTGLESHIREKTEQMIDEKGDLDDVHEDFMRYLYFRKQFEMAQTMKDKGDLLKMAFQHFMEKMSEMKGPRREMDFGGHWDMDSHKWGGDREMDGHWGQEGGNDEMDMGEKLKLMVVWKLFVEFETAWLQQNNIVALGLDEKTTRALFFETFGRFMKNAMVIKEKAESVDKLHQFFQESQEKGKESSTMKEKFMHFLQMMHDKNDY